MRKRYIEAALPLREMDPWTPASILHHHEAQPFHPHPFAAAAVHTAFAAATPVRRDDCPTVPSPPTATRSRTPTAEPVIFVGTNWPGSGETMIPEGIEWRSISDIVGMMKYVGYNFVRHTYASR